MGEHSVKHNTRDSALARFGAAGIGFAAALSAVAGGAALLRKVAPRRKRTMFGTAWTYNTRNEQGEWLRLLVVDGGCQGATYHGEKWNHLPFQYYRSFDRMFATPKHVERVLMLGGGGFSYPKHLLTRRPDVTLDVVEPDGAIIGIALNQFHLDRLLEECPDRIRIMETDAQQWLEGSPEPYDAIVNDAFAGEDPVRPLVTREFAQLAKEHLTPGGLYLANVVTYPALGDYSHLTAACEALQDVFANVQVVSASDAEFSEEENYLVVASDTPLDFPDALVF